MPYHCTGYGGGWRHAGPWVALAIYDCGLETGLSVAPPCEFTVRNPERDMEKGRTNAF